MKQKSNPHYLIYKITNLLNNKIYIGLHKTYDINDDYMGSGKNIKNEIELFGIENFKKEILFDFDNFDDMIKKEAELVNEEFLKRDDVYNIVLGGNAGGIEMQLNLENLVHQFFMKNEKMMKNLISFIYNN